MKSKRIVKTPKKVKGVKLPQYEFGTYVENPYSDLVENEIALVKAKNKASKNGWVKGLNIAGNLAMQYGTSMMNQGMSEGQGVSSGGFNWGSLLSQGIQGAGAVANGQGLFENGGKVGIPTPIEAEGEEVIETPNGDVSQLKGPSHSEGGIDMVVPSGSEIFSKKLKGADGKSMAERKIDREKKEAKVEKLLKDSPTDMTLKKTLQRTKANNEKVEQIDMMKMQFAKMMADMVQHYALGGVVQKYDGGGYVFPSDEEPKPKLPLNGIINPLQETDFLKSWEDWNKNLRNKESNYTYRDINDINNRKEYQKEIFNTPEYLDLTYNSLDEFKEPIIDGILGDDSYRGMTLYGGYKPIEPISTNPTTQNPNTDPSKINEVLGGMKISDNASTDGTGTPNSVQKPEGNPIVGQTQSINKTTGDTTGKYDWLNSITGSMTAGDMVGLFGQLYSTFKPMENTRANRAGDTPNINPFLNYGKDALAKMDQSKEYIKQIRDEQNKDLELSRTSAIKRGRNSARGVNTLRALDLAADANANNTKSQIFNQFAQAMQQIYDKESQLENEQDFRVMEGEYKRDENDRKDRDTFFEQMAQDIATKGAGLQHIGESFNQIKSRNVTNKIMQGIYNDFELDAMTGVMKKKLGTHTSNNATFYSSIKDPIVKRKISDGYLAGKYDIVGSTVIDKKTGKPIDLTKINETE